MKRCMWIVLLVFSLVLPCSVLAGGGAEVAHHSIKGCKYCEFFRVGSSVLPGVACYYGQDVLVEYEVTKSWTYVFHKGNVHQTIVQNGTASVYDMSGTLIDTRPFHSTERLFDVGTDVALRREEIGADETLVWYDVSFAWWLPELEEYMLQSKIPGIYDYQATNVEGVWESNWTSGDCQGGWSSE